MVAYQLLHFIHIYWKLFLLISLFTITTGIIIAFIFTANSSNQSTTQHQMRDLDTSYDLPDRCLARATCNKLYFAHVSIILLRGCSPFQDKSLDEIDKVLSTNQCETVALNFLFCCPSMQRRGRSICNSDATLSATSFRNGYLSR